MIDAFWKKAVAICGLAAVVAFVLYSLYFKWLEVSAEKFPQLKDDHAFYLYLAFLVLVFLAFVVGVYAWLKHAVNGGGGNDEPLFRLQESWKGVNYISCDSLVGPDVNKAAEALDMTSLYWRESYVDKKIIKEKYGNVFCELFEQLDRCDKQVPGYNDPIKYCSDFLSATVRETYKEVKGHE